MTLESPRASRVRLLLTSVASRTRNDWYSCLADHLANIFIIVRGTSTRRPLKQKNDDGFGSGLVQLLFREKLRHQVSHLGVIQVGEREVGISMDANFR